VSTLQDRPRSADGRIIAQPPEVRFWKFVQKQHDGCWRWIGTIFKTGYGGFNGGRSKGQSYAHRFSYEIAKGPISDGLHIDHLCRNRWCVNPDHL